ncbi:MAG: MoaD/ThiS family protein [Clostridia bacterium]|nr:MoaD/ThiS family protein [Clostridia bacterium]
MVTVKLFGTARVKFKDREVQLDVPTMKDVLNALAEKYNVPVKDFKQYVYFVNDVNISDLQKYKTQLKDGDIIMVISLGSGG